MPAGEGTTGSGEGALVEGIKDVAFGLTLVATGVFALVWIMNTPGGPGASGGISFATVPVICATLLIGLSAIYSLTSFVRALKLYEQHPVRLSSLMNWQPGIVAWRRLATVAGLIGFVFALQHLPFFVATLLLLSTMFVIYGHRSVVRVAIVSLLGSAAMTGLFVYALRLPI